VARKAVGMTVTILRANALHLPIADESVDLICSSPPYFGLRSYTDGGEHYEGQIGSEATPAEFVDALIKCTREFTRVLKPSGSIWVNLGDKYCSGTSSPRSNITHPAQYGNEKNFSPTDRRLSAAEAGVPAKSLLGIPWRYALACIDQLGLILRAEVIWSKPNGLPESVTDRVRRSHEQWFHFVRQPRYYSAVDEIREAHDPKYDRWHARYDGVYGVAGGDPNSPNARQAGMEGMTHSRHPLGKLPGSVWTINEGESLARIVLEAVAAGSLSVDEGERIWTGSLACGARSTRATAAGHGSGNSTATDTDATGEPESVIDERTDSSTSSSGGRSLTDSRSTTSVTTPIWTASEESAASTGDASTLGTSSPSQSPPISGDGHERIAAPPDMPSAKATPTSEPTESVNAAPAWPHDLANIEPGSEPPSVWLVPTEPLTVPPGLGVDHFAAFPTEWPRRIIAGWSPPGICVGCGEGRRPVTVQDYEQAQATNNAYRTQGQLAGRHGVATFVRMRQQATITGYVCACTPYTDHPGTDLGTTTKQPRAENGHDPRPAFVGSVWDRPHVGPWREYHHDRWTPPATRPAVVVDPFMGTGTVPLVADVLGRTGIGVDLSADYCHLAAWRTRDPGQRAKAARVDKPPPVIDGQLALEVGT
jgi:DNA modification methylase